MGVAGCGKSTIGHALADQLGGTYLEGDSFHPESNIEKMSAGTPLTDEDRWPWLKIIGQEMASAEGIIFAGCSALKLAYRDLIEKEVIVEDITCMIIERQQVSEDVRSGHGFDVCLYRICSGPNACIPLGAHAVAR